MRLRLFILLIFISTLSLAQTPKNISARDLISFSSIRNLELLEEKQLIIYQLRETDFSKNTYRNHLWKMKTDGSGARQLTFSSGDEWSPNISPTGACLAFFSNRADENGKAGTRIWAMPLSGGEAKPLTDADRTILAFDWSHDGGYIYYLTPAIMPEPSKSWKTQQEASGFDAIDRTSENPNIELWRIDKSNSEQKRLFVGDPGVIDFDVDQSGEHLVYATNYSGDDNDWVETDLFLFSLRDSARIRQLTGFKGSEESPRFSPNGRLIAYERPQKSKQPFSQTELEIIPIEGGKPVRLTKKLDLHMSTFSWFTNQSLLLEINQGMNNHIYSVSLEGETTELSGGKAYFFRSTTDHKSQSIAAVRQTANSLSEIVYSKGAGHPWTVISNQSAALNDLQIHPQTNFHWKSRDERFHLEGLVVLPNFSGHDPLPMIVDIHGGPAGRTDIALEQGGMYQAWASQGFAVFSPNYRGSEGYSATFQTANYKDLGGGDYHDIMSGVKELIRRGIAHPDSLVIMGGSYGGYMANWAITQTNRFKVAVSRYGIFDLKNDFSNSNYAQWELDYLGKTYWEDPSLYRRMSPSTFIKKAKTPTLILHGSDDENTFTSNSRELARALKTLDVPHRFFLYPREGHGFREPSHRLDVFDRQLNWINLHLNRSKAVSGEDWLNEGIRVQIVSADNDATFLNKTEETFLSVKVLIDGTRLKAAHELSLLDFQLLPENTMVLGVPSGRILAEAPYFSFDIGPNEEVIELELVFPKIDVPHQVLSIKGIGSYTISF